MGKRIETPRYRRLRKGEVIKHGDLCQLINDPDDPWEETGAAGLRVGHGVYTEACRYKRLIPKPAPKAKWEPVDFRRMLPKRPTITSCGTALEEATKIVNKLGAENARLKNQLAKLKGQK